MSVSKHMNVLYPTDCKTVIPLQANIHKDNLESFLQSTSSLKNFHLTESLI